MLTKIFVTLFALALTSSAAVAQCGAIPNTLTNGQNADASQVMTNFNHLRDCINGAPPSGIDDVARRNILLNTAAIAKINGAYVRNINTFADGYKGNEGINESASTHYTVNTGAGYISPQAAAIITSFSYTLTVDNVLNWSNYTTRSIIDSAQITLGSGTSFAITLEAPSATGITLDAVYVCVLSGTYGCAAAPVQVLFGGQGSTTISGGQSIVGDSFTLSGLGAGNSIVVAIHQTTSPIRTMTAIGNNKMYFLLGNDASNQNPGTYTPGNQYGAPVMVKKMTQGGSTFNNMTLITKTQTADGPITKGRVLLEYNPVNLITLKVDFLVDVTCNDGVNWTPGTLAPAGTAQGGFSLAETAETTCSTGGSLFAARIRTANNKQIQISRTMIAVR